MIMLLTTGLALIVIGIANILKVAFDVLKCTPKEEREDATTEVMFDNFIKNVSFEHIMFLNNLMQSNPLFFGTGTILIVMSFIV